MVNPNMTPKTGTRTALFLLATLLLVVLASPAHALGGAPPTLSCSVTFSPATGESSVTIAGATSDNDRAADVGTDNSYFVLVTRTRNIAPTTTITSLVKVDTACQTFSIRPDCEGGDGIDENAETFHFTTVRFDQAGRLVAGLKCVQDGVTSVHLATYFPNNLTRITRSEDLFDLAPSLTFVQDVASISNGEDDVDYLVLASVAGGRRMVRYDRNFTAQAWNVGGQATADLIECCDFPAQEFFFVGYSSGAAGLSDKVNATTGAVAATVTITSSRLAPVDKNPPIQTYGTADRAYFGKTSGNAGGTELARRNVTITTWTSQDADTYTPAQVAFNDPPPHVTLRDTDTYWWALDGADNVLMCGFLPVGPVPFFAHMKPSNETMFWNVTTTSPLVNTIAVHCGIDYGGSIWVAYSPSVGTTSYVRRYTGGGFTGISLRGNVVLPEPPAPPPGFVPADFGSGIANFAADIGFASTGGLFFFGLILVIIMFLVVAGATKGVTDNGVAAMLGGAIAGMGTMIFNTTQELWDVVWTVILIVLTSAVILFLLRSTFIGFVRGE